MVSIVTLNANGLRSADKRQKAVLVCEADITCLQETHWHNACVEELQREMIADAYVNNGGTTSRGVAISVKRGQIGNVRKSEDGRTIGISFDHLGREYKLVIIYAPNEVKEREDFFERMAATCCTECIIVGD